MASSCSTQLWLVFAVLVVFSHLGFQGPGGVTVLAAEGGFQELATLNLADRLLADRANGLHSIENGELDFELAGSSRHLLQASFNCYRSQVQCPSGIAECYSPDKGCDNVNDCSDGSDESDSFCSTYACPFGKAKCPSNKCSATVASKFGTRFFLCDGVVDCPDNSDEDPALCNSYDCESEGGAPCPGAAKQCISKISINSRPYPYYVAQSPVFGPIPDGAVSAVCDGVKDCKDNSDEDPGLCASFTCNTGGFKCGNVCVPRSKVCDGRYDCADNSDEDPTLCGPSYNCSQAGTPFTGGAYQHCPSGVGCYLNSQYSNCNGNFDCLDHSDEDPARCGASFTCPDFQTKCPSGVGCFYGGYALCNGRFDCADKSDESLTTCANPTCQNNQVRCPSGQGGCVDAGSICDGTINCIDGSDESDATCSTYDCSAGFSSRVRCPSGIGCVNEYALCNGVPGDGFSPCKDGSDEDPTFCQSRNCTDGQIRCRDGTCAYGSLCDGYTACADGSDEDPAFCKVNSCNNGQVKCADGVHCVQTFNLCDGTPQCADQSDEAPALCATYQCNSDQFKCASGPCIGNYNVCDGVKDCSDGSDEAPSFCATYNCPGPYQFKCPGTNVCVYGALCNGAPDCPDRSDESPAVCGSGGQPPSGPQGVCGSGDASAFPTRCYFNSDPQGRYVCCDSAGCDGFNPPDYLFPHCKVNGFVPPGYGVGTPVAQPPVGPPVPPTGPQGVCGSGDASAFPTRCYFNSDPQGRYVCCDSAGCDGFNPPDYLFPHCKNNGFVPPGYGITSGPPATTPPPAPASGSQGFCGRENDPAADFPVKCYFNNDLHQRYYCCDAQGCDGFNADNLTPHCKNNGYVPIDFGPISPSTPPAGSQGVCGSGDAGAFPVRCYFNSDPQGRYVCCDNDGCDGFLSDNLFPHCKSSGYVPPGYGV